MRAQIDSLIRSGRSARVLGQPAEALQAYRKAEQLARKANDTTALAHALRYVAELHLEMATPEAALAAGEEAVALLGGGPDCLGLANALRLVALALQSLGRPVEAAEAWTRARTHYTSLAVADGAAECDRALDVIKAGLNHGPAA